MNNKNRAIVSLMRNVLIIAMLGLVLSYGCKRSSQNNDVSIKTAVAAQPPQESQIAPADKIAPAAAGPTSIYVSFKLDPRITQGMYMGDRWVSPSTYTRVGEGKTCIIEAIASVFDDKGKPISVNPEWIADDEKMVTILPVKGNLVKITVNSAGQSSLRVIYGGNTKKMVVKSSYKYNALQVEITQ